MREGGERMAHDDVSDRVVTFRTTRGTFSIPRALKETDPEAWAYRFASSMPDDATATSVRDGELDLFTWRIIRVIELEP